MYLRVRLLEREFYFITYHHILGCMKKLADALANYVLDKHFQNL